MSKKISAYKKNYPQQSSREVDSIQDEINRIFEQHLTPLSSFSTENSTPVLQPNIEISETTTEVNVSAELPGMDVKDIEVNISQDGYLTISGEKQCVREKNDKKEGYYFSECSYGMIQRTISLPTDINIEKVSADFEKGILKIHIPKVESAQPKIKKIDVKSK